MVICFSGLESKVFDFGELRCGMLHEKHAVATSNMETVSAFIWKTGKRTKL
jgi:hypothetical protein